VLLGVISLNEIETIQKQILQAKEIRWIKQHNFKREYESTIISFKFNIPSWPKNSLETEKAFQKSRFDFCSYMKNNHQEISLLEQNETILGPEAFFLAKGNPEKVKELSIKFEESYIVGRLLDIDVLGPHSDQHIERGTKRKCYLCDKIAIHCMREENHTPIELRLFFDTLLKNFVRE